LKRCYMWGHANQKVEYHCSSRRYLRCVMSDPNAALPFSAHRALCTGGMLRAVGIDVQALEPCETRRSAHKYLMSLIRTITNEAPPPAEVTHGLVLIQTYGGKKRKI
jgi:hypothetical protein